MISKIRIHHTDKPAYIYIRQSTMGQVRHHQESTERQYALKEKAIELGWSPERVRIFDRDLGMSGAQLESRSDFKIVIADVSMQKVGAVFALEASRLARSCTDWHRLLELCAISGTLIIDEDGCYDPSEFNDQLLLGLKGTMSQAELHFLRLRLQGGKLNKARKGELRSPLPVGFVYDEQGHISHDPDEQVQGVVRLLFTVFREMRSSYGVVHEFLRKGVKFPKRAYGGAWNGKLIWGRLTDGRVLDILKNPTYAGVYAFGRHRTVKELSSEGIIQCRTVRVPMSDWMVNIRDHHEGYISWDEFLENQKILEMNRTNGEQTLLKGPVREGLTLLQGLLICGTCGRKLTVRYKGNGGIYAGYECNWRRREGLSTRSCLFVRSDLIDSRVSKRVLDVLKSNEVELALKALEEIGRRQEAVNRQWQMAIERAEYEAQLAERRYQEVDPSNRLVAATLEKRWNEALRRVEEIKEDFHQHRQKHQQVLTQQQRQQLESLARDLPRLWNAPSTNPKDRKRILRLLIKDITVDKSPQAKQIILHLRWQGGTCEDISVTLPPSVHDQYRYSEEIIEKVRIYAQQIADAEIAERLNEEGFLSAKGKRFTASMIQWIRYRHAISPADLRQPGQLTVKQVADKFAVTPQVVYYWIKRKIIPARRMDQGAPYWITIDSEKEEQLLQRVRNSNKIQSKNALDSETKL